LFIAGKPSILIIDDDPAILRTLSKVFQRSGYAVTVAEKGLEAKEKIGSSRFDVALIDLCLPDMEGTALFPLIQETSPDTLKIMLTGKTLSRNSIEGADALLGKPIAPDRLLSVIESKLKNRNIDVLIDP
jgi:DNA-binding NtrC family response regulator